MEGDVDRPSKTVLLRVSERAYALVSRNLSLSIIVYVFYAKGKTVSPC